MIVLQCVNVSKSFGAEPILENVKLEVQSKERVALVGRNGAGKSTLLKMIVGDMGIDSGDIVIPKNVELGYLSQHTDLKSTKTIWDEMVTVFEPLIKMEKQLRALEQQMADPMPNHAYTKLLQEYDQMQNDFKEQGGYQYEADIRGVLSGLHFQQFDYETPISSLSGGQKTRLALGKLLLSKPALLVLDEPTNHLDMVTLTWLENYLNNYPGSLLVVSHDRYFLDRLTTKVVELSRQQTTTFHGNYSFYLEEKAKRYEQELKQFEKQQAEIEKLETFVAKNLVRASTTKRAQSRRKQLEKMDRLERPQGNEKSASFGFDIVRQSGNDVLTIRELEVKYEDHTVFSNMDFALTRGESVCLLGDNGTGKTTLLKAVTKQIDHTSGQILFGSNVSVGYYDQEHAKLQSNKTVLQEVWDEFPGTVEKEIRSLLGLFLFSGDDVLKIVSSLSGGEKARVALAKLMMVKANLLILDEPTNHLDLDSKEVLEAALIDYPGTILFVSHDRYFINRIASRVVELESGVTTSYLGDYTYYSDKKKEMAERAALNDETTKTNEATHSEQTDKTNYQQDKELKRLERQKERRLLSIEEQIESLELENQELETQMLEPDVYSDHVKAKDIQDQLASNGKKMDALMEEWESLQ
ncbi:ABC-F family ATP-binding cassette domain-containing protein [Shouchella sp. 1P09AA]|uniref:ABC-F family ATP-binding cassette domain-containing protein n=1 Tax=unclassified Shouchella TaxID=2893065 RepID=UPI0039A0E724